LVQKLGLAKLIRASDWIILLFDAKILFRWAFGLNQSDFFNLRYKNLDQSEALEF